MRFTGITPPSDLPAADDRLIPTVVVVDRITYYARLFGGEPRSGKSALLSNLAAHAALTTDSTEPPIQEGNPQ